MMASSHDIFLGYNFCSRVSGELIPQRLQNLCIRDYAQSKGITVSFCVAEYWDASRSLMLMAQLELKEKISGFVFFSVGCIPPNPEIRKVFFRKCKEMGLSVHFALENLEIKSEADLSKVEDLYKIGSETSSVRQARTVRAFVTENPVVRVGIDLDNTLIDYRDAFLKIAKDLKIDSAGIPGGALSRESFKDYLVKKYGNDKEWQRVQSLVYSEGLAWARPSKGALEFLKEMKALSVQVYVVSHKSKVSHFDPSKEFWEPARKFISEYFGDFITQYYFEETQAEKIARIQELQLDFYLDDLSEITEHREFPKSTQGIKFESGPSEELQWSDLEIKIRARMLGEQRVKIGERLKTKGNSQITKLIRVDGSQIVLKTYSSEDSARREIALLERMRDRLRSNQVPGLIAGDSKRRHSILEHVNVGDLPQRFSATDWIQDACILLSEMQGEALADFPYFAPHARTSLRDYRSQIEARISGLRTELAKEDPKLAESLDQGWKRIMSDFSTAIKMHGLSLDAKIPQSSLILSPSDFGPHNSIVTKQAGATRERLVFLDFEYTGWDDPAKLICDVKFSVAHDMSWDERIQFENLVFKLLKDLGKDEGLKSRVACTEPLIEFEWVLIVLNLFDPEVARRKLSSDFERLKVERMARAKELLVKIEKGEK